MRTKLILWKIVREYIDELWKEHRCRALCEVVHNLYYKYDDVRSSKEKIDLSEEIKSYNPRDGRVYFLGEYGDKEARIQFIEKMIEKHSEN